MRFRRTAQTLAAAATLTLLAAPAVADTDNPLSGPPIHTVLVQDAGAPCEFPVQWDLYDKESFLELPTHFVALGTGYLLTFTNLDTGATLTLRGGAQVRFYFADDGTFTLVQGGVAVWPGIGMITTGEWSRTFFPDGTASDLTGTGTSASYCDLLS